MFACGKSSKRERFNLLTLIPPLPKEKVFDLSIANLGRKSLGKMIAFSETFHKSTFVIHFLHPLNCLKFNILIKFLKFWVYICTHTHTHILKWYGFLVISFRFKKQQNKLYWQYFILVKDSLGIYQLFNALYIIIVILIFSECYFYFMSYWWNMQGGLLVALVCKLHGMSLK